MSCKARPRDNDDHDALEGIRREPAPEDRPQGHRSRSQHQNRFAAAYDVRRIVIMKKTYLTATLLALSAPLSARAADGVKVVAMLNTKVTSTGQPIMLPGGHVRVITSIYEIAPGAKLPEHKHIYPRYGYLMSGQLRVTNVETGTSTTFNPGDFIIESLGQWHTAKSIGADPIKLLVIDQVPKGQDNVVLRNRGAVTH
jgi:quercetin dioxygenase-like cupin family protein